MAEKFTVYENETWTVGKLIKLISQFDSVLDIGCGNGRIIKKVDAPIRWGVDICQAAITQAKQKNPDSVKFIVDKLCNLSLHFGPKSIDCVIGIDIIEHFHYIEAVELLHTCDVIARKCLIFFVPVGNHPQTEDDRGYSNDHYQTHRSTWYPEMMKMFGYNVNLYPNWHKNIKPPKEKGAMWCLKKQE